MVWYVCTCTCKGMYHCARNHYRIIARISFPTIVSLYRANGRGGFGSQTAADPPCTCVKMEPFVLLAFFPNFVVCFWSSLADLATETGTICSSGFFSPVLKLKHFSHQNWTFPLKNVVFLECRKGRFAG